MSQVCYYHAGCPDGFGAAWAVWNAWGADGRYVARGHDDRIRADELEDAVVVFVDIAPTNPELRELNEVAEQVIVLDHHISSLERFQSSGDLVFELRDSGHEIHFDLDHSGAALAWEYFGQGRATPELLRYVEDQDLWNWKLPRSEEVNAAIGSYARSFDTWTELSERSAESLALEGEPIVRANRMEVQRVLHHATPVTIAGKRVEAVDSTSNRSNVGHELAKRKAFGAEWGCVYRLEGTRVHASLYSIGDLDVSRISAEYGGGGHRNAAGFSVSLERWLREIAG